jgi:cation diffusion facilitator family transporter
LKEVTSGLVLMSVAGVINGGLGWYLIQIGKSRNSIIVKANGLHVISDCYTTIIAIAGAGLAAITGIIYFDTAVAILGGLYIAYEALKMLREAVGGLMDEADLTVDDQVKKILSIEADRYGWRYHELRHRSEGNRNWIEMHLIFSDKTSLKEAHDHASHLEATIAQALDSPVIITTHLEPESHRHDDFSAVSAG